ncbi:TVA4 protein, partial [Tricholaema leucomelas]|nr:TVA4 protein [Tricholaema leucomelas]
FFPVAAAAIAQVQQEPSADTTEGTGISVTCSHPNIQSHQIIYWYRQLPRQGPTFLVGAIQGSQELRSPAGRLSVAADRRSNTLWLARPRLSDAALYSCALGD